MLTPESSEQDTQLDPEVITRIRSGAMAEAYERTWKTEREQDQKLRDDPLLRAQMVKLIAELGPLVYRHATELGVRAEQDCPFQVDTFAELITWQLAEFLTQVDFDREQRADNTHFYQVTERHARFFFDLESEGG